MSDILEVNVLQKTINDIHRPEILKIILKKLKKKNFTEVNHTTKIPAET